MTKEPVILRVHDFGVKEEVGNIVVRLTGKGIIFTILVTLTAIAMFIRGGLALRATILLTGSLLSIAGLIGFNRNVIQQAAGELERSWGATFAGLGGFVPYLFSCYLTFYEGIWQIIHLFKEFSLLRLAAAIFFLIAGYSLVKACHRISELGMGLAEGRIVIQQDESD